jgi:hypothetical protein
MDLGPATKLYRVNLAGLDLVVCVTALSADRIAKILQRMEAVEISCKSEAHWISFLCVHLDDVGVTAR